MAQVDAAFGSLGSFFAPELSERLSCGAYEANPPYEPAVVDAVGARLESLFQRAERGGQARAQAPRAARHGCVGSVKYKCKV